jgi:hypothetical protein
MGNTGGITEKQLATIAAYEAKEKLTDKQREELAELKAKTDAPPQLSAGAKTYCEDWIKSKLYGKGKTFTSKYTDKGIDCEPQSIAMVAEKMGYGLVYKNNQQFSNDWCTGEPDLLLPNIVEEIKNSWDCYTFPLLEPECPSKDYILQVHGYMWLTGRKKAAINYTLNDTPDHMIDKIANKAKYELGMEEVSMDFWDEIKREHTYSHLPIDLRLKRYEFEHEETIINTIKRQVELCREYINQIVEQYKLPL